MTVEGHIENGQVVLDSQLPFPEGMRVRVELLDNGAEQPQNTDESTAELPSLYERMKPFIGSVKGLPSDFAINHDHYLHGQSKRQ
jgi:hypothetical protein